MLCSGLPLKMDLGMLGVFMTVSSEANVLYEGQLEAGEARWKLSPRWKDWAVHRAQSHATYKGLSALKSSSFLSNKGIVRTQQLLVR